MSSFLQRLPRLAYPFTILPRPGSVLLVAGEDYRFTLVAPGLDGWLPGVLSRCDGGHSIEVLLSGLAEEARPGALELLKQLYGERVLVDGPAHAAHQGQRYRLVIEGTGPMREMLSKTGAETAAGSQPLVVLCQDRLDYAAALDWQQRCRRDELPGMWISHGPMERAYVSPLFLPHAGPCFGCLFRSFQRLSPAPEVYDALLEQQKKAGTIVPVPFPAEGLALVEKLFRWKVSLAAGAQPPAALYRLHVLEREALEVHSHRVFVDPDCPQCRERRP